MIKISEFSPAISSNREHSAVANCKVVINGGSQQANEASHVVPPVRSRGIPAEPEPIVYPNDYVHTEEIATSSDLYRHLAISFSNILKSNNIKLLANLIDQSGTVVLSANDLVTAIALMLGMDDRNIRISYEDPDSTCLSKVSPIKIITAIKVNGYDFNLAYNRQYNELSDVFSVSITRCLIL